MIFRHLGLAVAAFVTSWKNIERWRFAGNAAQLWL